MSYYLGRRSRAKVEQEFPMPIASLDEDTGEVLVDWTTYYKDDWEERHLVMKPSRNCKTLLHQNL